VKQTHKFRVLGNVESIVAAAPSVAAAARQLGVDRSTVHRWISAGRVEQPSRRRRKVAGEPTQPPASWAATIRLAYELSPTEDTLVDLAAQALSLTRDATAKPETRLAAMGRFQMIVRQLHLEEPDGEAQKSKEPVQHWPRRVG
jgi:hypothetical protein